MPRREVRGDPLGESDGRDLGMIDLLMLNKECSPYHPDAFKNMQSLMLSSTLLPFGGFVVDAGFSLEELMEERDVGQETSLSQR